MAVRSASMKILLAVSAAAACGGDDSSSNTTEGESGSNGGGSSSTTADTSSATAGTSGTTGTASSTETSSAGTASATTTGTTGSVDGASLAFVVNATTQHDYGQQLAIPPGFGQGEFTFELWIRPDDSFPFGPTDGGDAQLMNWADADNMPYSDGGWWFDGNFLLDGHNNGNFADGTFSLQFYGEGRVRWLFGDGISAGAGGHWSVGAYPADTTPPLVDGQWHQLTLVRRFAAGTDSTLELWVDGALVATETSTGQVDMRTWWDDWSGFPQNQPGWFWGAEKQAAVGDLDQYEDYKGLVSELRFWSVAKSTQEIEQNWNATVDGSEAGLVGYIPFDEGTGTEVCDRITQDCFEMVRPGAMLWVQDAPPLQ